MVTVPTDYLLTPGGYESYRVEAIVAESPVQSGRNMIFITDLKRFDGGDVAYGQTKNMQSYDKEADVNNLEFYLKKWAR